MKKITFLFALLCASVMGWAGVAQDTWIPTTAPSTEVYAEQFKWFAISGENYEGVSVNQIEDHSGVIVIYVNFPDAGFDAVVGCERLDDAGALAFLKVSSLLTQENTDIYIKNGETVRWAFRIQNTKYSSGGGSSTTFDPTSVDWTSSENTTTYYKINDQFQIAAENAANMPTGPLNIQQPAWAAFAGIYIEVPAGVSACAFNDVAVTDGDEFDGNTGAGIVLNPAALTNEITKVTVTHGLGTTTFYVHNANAGGSDPEPTEVYDTNFALISLGASATSSAGGTANNAIDNNDGSSWESTHGVDEVMLTIDLGQKRIFNTVQIRWEGAYGKAFTIDVSNDNDTWTTVKTVDETLSGFPHEQTLEFAKTTARYIRFNGTQRGTQWGYNMFSFRVLLPGVSVLTSIDLTAPAQIAEVGGVGVALTAQPKDQNGQNMEAEISWEITPAAAGHMSGSTYIPDQAGSASIRAYSGEIYSPAVTIAAYEGTNVALNKTDDDITASGYDTTDNLFPRFAVDDNDGSLWSARHGETGDERIYDAWINVDLGAYYDINLIAIRWEGACSRHYHVDFSADNSAWRTAYNAGWNAVATHWEYLIGTSEDATKVRYVRVWSTEAVSQYGVKIMALKVYGTPWVPSGDTEAPVMGEASLVSNTYTEAVLSVAATDNVEVARFHVVDNANGIDANYVANAGQITITGLTDATDYNFTITAIDVAGLESENSAVVPVSIPFNSEANLALNKPCEGGYYDNNPAESADKANDGNNGTSWVTYGAHAAALDWWVVDLGKVYNLTNITALWANDAYATQYMLQARVDAPTNEDKADDAAWVTLETVSGVTAGEERSTNVSGVGRYVRFRATAFAGGFFRLREFRVYASGVADVDTEAPAMTSASLVSNTDSHAVIAVAATDNQGVASFHVVDAGNSFDAKFAAEGGNITVTGLAGGTAYNFTITAIDFFGNESANSKSVAVTTTAHYTEPQAACAAPTWDASLVKAIYSPTYSANCNLGEWGSGTVVIDDTYGKKYTIGPNGEEGGYFGMVDFTLNCLLMEKLHFDIWVADDMTIRFVPIWGGAEQGITKSLVGQQWNSIDIDLTEYTGITNWSNITQMKLDHLTKNVNIWIANAYFYREAPYVDTEAPTNASASKVAEGFYSVQITAQAEDNSGAVNFKVMNGEEVLATGAAATGVATTITVNNLTPGTNYNFNVVAYDEANNEAEPVVVAAETKFMPAAAPAPDFNNKKVVAVFTDAMACVVSGIQSGGWGETTQVEWLDIAEGDKVFYGQNFNYAGWHSWAGGNIDATGMQFLHVDIYSAGMTAVNVTPISPGPVESSATITLTPNAWTSYDVPLSAYDANNIDWANIFQFKFMGPVGGNELMIDNVYFWSYQVTPNAAQGTDAGGWATFAAPIKLAVPAGLTAYKASYEKTETEEILNLTPIDVIPANAGVILKGTAGSDYILTPTDAEASDVSGNVLVGCVTRTDVSDVRATKDIFCMRYSGSYDFTGFFLYEGQYVPANRAYLPLDKISGPNNAPRKVRFVINGEQTTTGVENADSATVEAVKFIENGQLFIRRGEAVYNLQGVRVK